MKILLKKLWYPTKIVFLQGVLSYVAILLCEIFNIAPLTLYGYSLSHIDYLNNLLELLGLTYFIFSPIFISNSFILIYAKKILYFFNIKRYSLLSYLFLILLNIILFLIIIQSIFPFLVLDFIKIIPSLIIASIILTKNKSFCQE